MGQHGFAENATITHLSHSIPSLCAGMSVKDKLSDYLTEIKFHTAPSSLKKLPQQDKACTVDTFTMGKLLHYICIRYIYTVK